MKIRLEVSARHIHLSESDFLSLFGDAKITKRNDLSQKGEFAANQSVEVVGPNGRFAKVRVLGPFRELSQLEISKTDCFYLGIDAPVALSGAGKGAHIKIVGPKGSFIKSIAMIAKRHIHLSLKSSIKYKLKNGAKVSVFVASDRATIYKDTIVRVDESFVDSFHVDTDEANASDAQPGINVIVTKE